MPPEPSGNRSVSPKLLESRGRLRLKGERRVSSKKKRKITDSTSSQNDASTLDIEETAGSGRVVSSGVTIHGFETQFKQEVDVADRIILFHPKSLQDESRFVVAILSQRSLTLDSPFSTDVASTTAYRVRKESVLLAAQASAALGKPAERNGESTAAGDKEELQDEISRQLQKKLQSATRVLKYREKTGMWGYRTVTERVSKHTTAEELLDMRAKRQGRDKYCW